MSDITDRLRAEENLALTSRFCGLRLVNFLARHQLRAETSFTTGKSTEFNFSLNQPEN